MTFQFSNISFQSRQLFLRLAIVTTATFLLMFLPFLPPFAPAKAILDPITRIFPFARGLFEDKVANFWCASNVLFKWKVWFSSGVLIKLATFLTALGFLPSVVGLIYSAYKNQVSSPTSKPQESPSSNNSHGSATTLLPLLPLALLTSSMSFFLFSFQVHEKSILVPLLPLTLLLSGSSSDSTTFELGVLVNNVAVFRYLFYHDAFFRDREKADFVSFPLGFQYVAASQTRWPSFGVHRNHCTLEQNNRVQPLPVMAQVIHTISIVGMRLPDATQHLLADYHYFQAVYTACLAVHALESFIQPPPNLPDIYPVLNVLISTPVFALAWLWSIKRGVEVAWSIHGLGTVQPAPPTVNLGKENSEASSTGIQANINGAEPLKMSDVQMRKQSVRRSQNLGKGGHAAVSKSSGGGVS